MNILTWTVALHSIFQFVPVTSEVGGGHCGCNTWGLACDRQCPSNCRPSHGTVHFGITTGECLEVHCGITTGECLEGCSVGYHGTTCSRECNSNCINNTCNQVDGECTSGCKNGTSCIVTAPPTNNTDTDITQTQCDFTRCLGYSVSLVVVTVLLCALVGLFVYAIWRRHKMQRSKWAEESVEMNGLDIGYSN